MKARGRTSRKTTRLTRKRMRETPLSQCGRLCPSRPSTVPQTELGASGREVQPASASDRAALLRRDRENGGTRRHAGLEIGPARRRIGEGGAALEALEVFRAVGSRMLHGEEERRAVRCEAGAADLRADGRAENASREAA